MASAWAWCALLLAGGALGSQEPPEGVNAEQEFFRLLQASWGYQWTHQLEEARDYAERALARSRTLGLPRRQAEALDNVGRVYIEIDLDRALAYKEEALALYRSLGDRINEVATLAAIGLIKWELGEQQDALHTYQEALALCRAGVNPSVEGRLLVEIGLVHESLGDWPRARDHIRQGLDLLRAAGDRRWQAIALHYLGRVQLAEGDAPRALETQLEALKLSEETSDRRWQGVSLRGVGAAQAALGRREQALEALQRGLALLKETKDQRSQPTAAASLGQVYESLGRRAEARDAYLEAVRVSQALRLRPLEATARYLLARLSLKEGDLAAARQEIEAAIALSEQLRVHAPTRDLRAAYGASVHSFHELAIEVLMRLHQQRPGEALDVRAFEVSERGRARTLLELLAEAHVDFRAEADSELLAREERLHRQLGLRAQRLAGAPGEGPATDASGAQARQTRDLTAEYQEVQDTIRRRSPRYADLTQPPPLTVPNIQGRMMDPETVLLEYALGEERSYVWAVTSSSVTSHVLAGSAEIEDAARLVYDLLRARPTRVPSGGRDAEEALARASARLSELVLRPVAHRLTGKRLRIVAEGALQYVPFGVLPDPAGSPLVARYEIVNLPSASMLVVRPRPAEEALPARKAVLVVADPVFDSLDSRVHRRLRMPPAGPQPALEGSGLRAAGGRIPRLPFTRQEAMAVASLLPAPQVTVALDFQARRELALSPDLSRFRLVHFATHGVMNNTHPELSGLLLSLVDERGRPVPGFVGLADIFGLRLSAEVVVLSACQSALGKPVRGEGLVGITRAFMYAGASQVLASLWTVDDAATARLMEVFYRGLLKENLRPSAALRAAQVSVSAQKRWSAPYYWAGFVLQGEGR